MADGLVWSVAEVTRRCEKPGTVQSDWGHVGSSKGERLESRDGWIRSRWEVEQSSLRKVGDSGKAALRPPACI